MRDAGCWNGLAIARNRRDLTDGSPLEASITVTETGGGPGDSLIAWSATQSDGTFTFGTTDCITWSTNANEPHGALGNIVSLARQSTAAGE